MGVNNYHAGLEADKMGDGAQCTIQCVFCGDMVSHQAIRMGTPCKAGLITYLLTFPPGTMVRYLQTFDHTVPPGTIITGCVTRVMDSVSVSGSVTIEVVLASGAKALVWPHALFPHSFPMSRWYPDSEATTYIVPII